MTSAPTSRLRASAHPLRLRILSLLTGAELSATDVAAELGTTHANASYHLRVLHDAGLIVVAGEEKVRGGLVKRYRHPWDDPAAELADAATATAEDQLMFVRVAAEELVRRRAAAEQVRTTERETGRDPGRRKRRGYQADAEMWVEPEVWDRVVDLLAEAGGLLHAEARPPRAPGTIPVNLTAFAFELGTGAPAQAPGQGSVQESGQQPAREPEADR